MVLCVCCVLRVPLRCVLCQRFKHIYLHGPEHNNKHTHTQTNITTLQYDDVSHSKQTHASTCCPPISLKSSGFNVYDIFRACWCACVCVCMCVDYRWRNTARTSRTHLLPSAIAIAILYMCTDMCGYVWICMDMYAPDTNTHTYTHTHSSMPECARDCVFVPLSVYTVWFILRGAHVRAEKSRSISQARIQAHMWNIYVHIRSYWVCTLVCLDWEVRKCCMAWPGVRSFFNAHHQQKQWCGNKNTNARCSSALQRGRAWEWDRGGPTRTCTYILVKNNICMRSPLVKRSRDTITFISPVIATRFQFVSWCYLIAADIYEKKIYIREKKTAHNSLLK